MIKLGKSLKIYKEIDKTFELLESTGHFALLYTSLLSLYDNIGCNIHKDNLKQILSTTIDHLWSDKFVFTDLTVLKDSQKLPNSSSFIEKKIKTSQVSFNSAKKSNISHISEFSYFNGPGTFSKTKKTVKIEQSPGPSDYSVDIDITKPRSPRIITPQSKKYTSMNSEIPGPGSYSPIHSFKSR
jgi:hypothetical protein